MDPRIGRLARRARGVALACGLGVISAGCSGATGAGAAAAVAEATPRAGQVARNEGVGSAAPSGEMRSAAGSGGMAAGADLAALRASGIDRYLGAARPASMEPGPGGATVYRFAVEDGPRCLRGDPYAMSTRTGDRPDLVIYLQGGGSCSSAICSANLTAEPAIPAAGLLNPGDPLNPVSAWNLVYVPYCDGSLHYGDKDHLDESPPRYHHGLRNLSAALDVALAHFPQPGRILLAGSSAGGLGTIYAAALVRLLYPAAQLFVWNDSGTGISKPDGSRARITRDEWGIESLIPSSCPECRASPHSTPVIGWNLQRDPGLRVALFSAYEDDVLANTFLMIGGPAFQQALLDETGKLTAAQPERARRFFITGTQHTTAGDMTTAQNGLRIGDWLGFMLASDARWQDSLQ